MTEKNSSMEVTAEEQAAERLGRIDFANLNRHVEAGGCTESHAPSVARYSTALRNQLGIGPGAERDARIRGYADALEEHANA